LSSDWPSEKPDSTRKAREAAEALFRPKPPGAPVAASPVAPAQRADVSTRAELPQPPVRQPRILATPSTLRAPELQPAPAPVAEVQPRVARPRATAAAKAGATPRPPRRKLSATEHQRIVTLVTYGMTLAQAAALYDVSIEAIEKIVAAGDPVQD
jgi:hypothetical protein